MSTEALTPRKYTFTPMTNLQIPQSDLWPKNTDGTTNQPHPVGDCTLEKFYSELCDARKNCKSNERIVFGYLGRHGISLSNEPDLAYVQVVDPGLSPTGINETTKQGKLFREKTSQGDKGLPKSCITFTSPLTRAWQTAALYQPASQTGVSVVPIEAFREQLSTYLCDTRRTITELPEAFSKDWRDAVISNNDGFNRSAIPTMTEGDERMDAWKQMIPDQESKSSKVMPDGSQELPYYERDGHYFETTKYIEKRTIKGLEQMFDFIGQQDVSCITIISHLGTLKSIQKILGYCDKYVSFKNTEIRPVIFKVTTNVSSVLDD